MRCSGKISYEISGETNKTVKGEIDFIDDEKFNYINAKGKVVFDTLDVKDVTLKGKIIGNCIIADEAKLSGNLSIKKLEANNVRISYEKSDKIEYIKTKNNVKITRKPEIKFSDLDINIGRFHMSVKGNLNENEEVPLLNICEISAGKVEIEDCIVDYISCDTLVATNCSIKKCEAKDIKNINCQIG